MSGMPVTTSDLEYLQILREVKPYITCIINIHYIGLIKLWLERLSEDFPDKHLRNIYLQRLCKQIEDGVLEYPFTDPPPDGELIFFSDDDNEAYFAVQEVLSVQQVRQQVPKNDQGDVRMHDISPVAEDDNSWVDVSDCSSVVASDGKFDQQTKIIDQLRHENKELMKMIAKNDNYIELNQDLTDKVIELQKQLAKAMLRNVDLQKNMQNMQEQREQCLEKTTEIHKQEMEILKVQYQEVIDERKRSLKQDVDVKCSDFTKKYKRLQDWYQNKLVAHNLAMEEKCTYYQKSIQELQAHLEEEEKKFQETHEEDILQLETIKKKTAELKELLEEEHKKTQLQHDKYAKDYEAKLDEKDLEYQKQLDVVQGWKEKFEIQATHFRKCLDDENSRHQHLIAEQLVRHQKDLKQLREEHGKFLKDQNSVYKEEVAQQAQKSKEQQRVSDRHCASLVKQCEQLKTQVTNMQIDLDNQRVEHQQQVENYQKQAKDEYITLQSQLSAQRQQIEELNAKNKEEINAIRLKHQQKMDEQESVYKQVLDEERASHKKVVADFEAVHQHDFNEKLSTCIHEIGDQTIALQKNYSEITAAHQRLIEEMTTTHLHEVKRLRATFDNLLAEKSASHRKCIQERHVEQHKLVNNLQILFDNHRQAMELQKDNQKVATVLKDECFRLCTEVQNYWVEKERSKGEIGHLGEIVNHLRDIIAKMKDMHNMKETELHKKVMWLQDTFQKYMVLQNNRHSKYITNEEKVVHLEAKYKRILLDLQHSAKKDREKYTKRITDLESRLSFRLLKPDK